MSTPANNLNRVAVAVLFVMMAVGTAVANQVPQCAAFPESDFWSVTHSSIASYVKRKHDGDWKPYIGKWQKQLANMRNIQKRGGSAVFKSKGITISGERLADYLKDLETRIEITKCLANWQK